MRRVRYAVACSLDGFIAGPGDEADWITVDPDLDLGALMAEFDTYLIGRRTFEATGMAAAGAGSGSGLTTVVFSRTLDPADYPGTRIVSDGVTEVVNELKAREGRDIWLFGGGGLFRSLLERRLVDTVEVGIIPVLLGEGVPLLAEPGLRRKLVLTKHTVYENSGTVGLEYAIDYDAA